MNYVEKMVELLGGMLGLEDGRYRVISLCSVTLAYLLALAMIGVVKRRCLVFVAKGYLSTVKYRYRHGYGRTVVRVGGLRLSVWLIIYLKTKGRRNDS